jgi:NADPH-dependent curcumin reductase CurA
MTGRQNRQWHLVRRPSGAFSADDFEFKQAAVPEPGEGEFRVRLRYLSADPTQRIWAHEESYFPIMPLGQVAWGIGAGTVEASRNPAFPEGAGVSGVLGMQDYAISNGQGVNRLPDGLPLEAALAVFGHIGITAYFGMLDVAGVQAGQTVVVSGAAGAVGSLAGQIAKLQGCRVVGIAGSDEKCEWITRDLGFDAAINYRKDSLPDALKKYCAQGINAYFDNVGGPTLDAVLPNLALHARIALCGMISDYTRDVGYGVANLRQLIFKRARIEGFLVMDYRARAGEAMDALGRWLQEGKLKYRLDVVEGLENAVSAVNRLLEGGNIGKVVIRV